ncbi:phospholipase B1, membrane-associated-like [Anabrus simplex]|uniref:phospholipase B1, membrane-associated-like n=1 Tax=Anabrus simplex TaxID=316456 RepID=UPI0035A373B2
MGLKDLKPFKSPGFDGIHPEFLIHLGGYAKKWLAEFFTDILLTGQLPLEFKKAKEISVLKPGKPSNKSTFKFYQDNNPKHKSYLVREWLLYNCPKVLETPPQSPDLNPIGNMWSQMKIALQLRPPSSLTDLKRRLLQEWAALSHLSPVRRIDWKSMLLSGFGGVLLLIVSESCAQSSLASLRTYELVKEAAVNSFMPRSRDRHLHKLLQQEKRQSPVPAEKPFPCSTDNSRSQSRPTSVHQLRPGDIDVVGAIGDSLTAGNGIEALNMFQVFVENRGSAWSIGGDRTWRELLTLPNILKEFNPNLMGYSLGDSLSHHRSSQFNVADPAAMSQDTHFQARNLWKRMRGDSRIDFNNDWKLVTLMIGANDFCSNMCYVNSTELPEKHRFDLIKTLDFLRDNMPRTLVNVVAPPNLEVLMNFKGMPNSCYLMVGFECSCLFGLAYRQRRQEFIDLMRRWQQLEVDVINSDRYHEKEDFTVVFQPFTMNITFPTTDDITDYTYMSYDCFHLSQKTHALAANGLWNNMLQPVGSKSTNWPSLFSEFLCPSEKQPYIYTANNSDASP